MPRPRIEPTPAQARAQRDLRRAVARAIAKAMKDAGVTRAELSRRLGVTRSSITQMLAGDRNLTLATLADVGTALGVRWGIESHTARRTPRERHR